MAASLPLRRFAAGAMSDLALAARLGRRPLMGGQPSLLHLASSMTFSDPVRSSVDDAGRFVGAAREQLWSRSLGDLAQRAAILLTFSPSHYLTPNGVTASPLLQRHLLEICLPLCHVKQTRVTGVSFEVMGLHHSCSDRAYPTQAHIELGIH